VPNITIITNITTACVECLSLLVQWLFTGCCVAV